jgi:thiol-disulfide isomerase/thioredoxin
MAKSVQHQLVATIAKPARLLVIGAGVLFFAPVPTRAGESAKPLIGSVIPELHFKDIRCLRRSLKELGDRQAFVFVFTNTTCPVAQRYWPKLKQLDEEYGRQGVQFVSVNVAPEDSIAQVAQQAIDFAVAFPFVKDSDGSAAKALGVERTPEVIILDAKRRLRYRGRIDDQQRLGGARPQLASDDLKQALDAVLAGAEPPVTETAVDGCLITFPAEVVTKEPVTFWKNIAPLFQKHCQECHHADSPAAPFSLVTFEEASNHAETIAEVVSDQRMPPWFGNRRHRFSNERGLSPAERRMIVAWARGGRIEGDPAAAPALRTFVHSKWEIGEPDLVTTALETHTLPADGIIDYQYVVLPYVFTEDTWISEAEILPDNPRVVHHCNMGHFTIGKNFSEGNFITGRVPGGTPLVAGDGVALRIPKNSVVGLQIHYTTTGKPEKNRMSVGFKFPRGIVHKELKHLQVTTSNIAIPPGAAAHPIVSSRTLAADASGIGMFAHMHLRGKDMTFIAHSPTGETETLLSIPNYNYAWQQNYRWEPGTKKFPRGTRIEVIAHYDNSPFNPWNPDPKAEVGFGPQTFHEMMFGFFFYTEEGQELNLSVDPKSGRAAPPLEQRSSR